MTMKIKGGWVTGMSTAVVAGMLALVLAGGSKAVWAQGGSLSGLRSDSLPLLLHTKSQGYLGVDVGDIDADRAQALHLKEARGAEITVLDHDAPAGKAGLKLHDVVVQMSGQPIDNADQLKRMLHETPVGRKIQLGISRDGVLQTMTVQMADRRKVREEAREQIGSSSQGYGQGFMAGGGDMPSTGGMHGWSMGSSLKIGALVEPLTAQMADFLGVTSGLMIKGVAHKSPADAAGLREHDVILEVGSEAVVTMSDWERLVRSSEGKPVQVTILRDRTKQLVLLVMEKKRHG